MRKFKMLWIFSIVVLATGCVKMDVTMDIKKDKSMDLKITEAISNSLMQTKGNDSILSAKNKAKMEKEGYKVEKYSENGMTGVTVTKEYKNIDDLSDTKDVKGDLSLKKSGSKLFTIKKGLFKNTYIAKLKSSDSNSVNSQMNSSTTINDDNEDSSINITNNGSSIDYTKFMSSMDMKFKITLPYKPISNNATEVSKDGKTLTWDLLKHKGSIEFKFSLYNMTCIYICVGVGIILVAAVVVTIVLLNKKKKTQKTEE